MLPIYQRPATTRLRRTSYGGAAFLPDRAATVELNAQAFALLCWLAVPQDLRQLRDRYRHQFGDHLTLAELDHLARRLMDYGFLEPGVPGHAAVPVFTAPEAVPIAPESVHLQLSRHCNLHCPACYVVREQADTALPLTRWLTLVTEIATAGVFQLAIGGGEPLLSPQLIPVIRQARAVGLLPNITTNLCQVRMTIWSP